VTPSPEIPALAAMAERRVLPPRAVEYLMKKLKDWLVPPVLFPAFLILLIIAYWLLKTPAT
jgi:hypothetical protein